MDPTVWLDRAVPATFMSHPLFRECAWAAAWHFQERVWTNYLWTTASPTQFGQGKNSTNLQLTNFLNVHVNVNLLSACSDKRRGTKA